MTAISPAAALFGLSWFALAVFFVMNAVAQPRPGYQPMRGSDDIPPPPQTGSGVKDAHAPEPAVVARALAVYRLACAVETAANAIASLTDRVAALEAVNARREREAAPRPFSAD